MKNTIIITILLLTTLVGRAHPPYRDEPAFIPGEYAIYNVYYNLGFIWMHAGNVVFTVEEEKEGNNDYYKLQLAGYTLKTFDRFYRIRDTFSVKVTKEDLMPSFYREAKHEDSFFADRRYYFDYEDDPQVVWNINRKGKVSIDSLKIHKSVFDLLTTCYRFRSLDVSQITKGTLLPFDMMFDKSIYNLGLKYAGQEKIKLRNKKEYDALKFMPKLITGDLFKHEDDMAIYVSDDANHVPLYIYAKIKVGAVKVMLESVKNTKYPFSAQIK